MARPKKDGRRATGIQGKKGYLYIVFSEPVIKNGVRKIEKRWIATGLADTPDNVKKASATRTKMLSKDPDTVFDACQKKKGSLRYDLLRLLLPGQTDQRIFWRHKSQRSK